MNAASFKCVDDARKVIVRESEPRRVCAGGGADKIRLSDGFRTKKRWDLGDGRHDREFEFEEGVARLTKGFMNISEWIMRGNEGVDILGRSGKEGSHSKMIAMVRAVANQKPRSPPCLRTRRRCRSKGRERVDSIHAEKTICGSLEAQNQHSRLVKLVVSMTPDDLGIVH